MTAVTTKSAPQTIAPAGFLFLGIMTFGAAINWPVQKFLLAEWPPMSARGLSGFAAGLVLAAITLFVRQKLAVPAGMWMRLLISAFLNITTWVLLMGFALTILPASEAAIIAYTSPIWTVLLAAIVLGERLSFVRIVAVMMAFAGIASLLGGGSFAANMAKLPGYLLALATAFTYAAGTIFLKKFPVPMPPLASASWQLGLGCLPVALMGLVIERPDVAALTIVGWTCIAYNITIQQCLGYVCWLAALHRLPASVASIGTMFIPILGVLASAYALGEPLGPAQIAALVFTVGSVLLAVRT
jgi:drug/metabolite transporter (DMT)-like permease